MTTGAGGQDIRFDVNDVSYLWPAPQTSADVAALISADDVLIDGKTSIWPRAAFDTIIAAAQTVVVESSAGRFDTISFGDFVSQFQDPHTWKVVAFRVDPCAPGCHHDLVSRFGSSPQIRLVLQPVTVSGSTVTVHDLTAHLVFSFTSNSAIPFEPDHAAFQLIVDDLAALKSSLTKAGVPTTGLLRVHPGLRGASAMDFGTRVKSFIRSRLAEQRLIAAAFMGLAPRPEPWIFFAMRRDPQGKFVPAPHPALGGATAQMLTLRGGDPVMPAPAPMNLPVSHGISTSLLFATDAADRLNNPALPNPGAPLLRDVADFIANPERANFFNTDCVSCHTESSRRQSLAITTQTADVRFAPAAGVSGVDPSVLPSDQWNVRNFGWFPSFSGPAAPTATQRTANESAESADAINRLYLSPQTSPAATKEPAMDQPVANPLTLVMKIKSDNDFLALSGLIQGIQSLPPDTNPIISALNKLGTVHFARFVFIENRLLAVITTYDGEFDRYIDAFVDALGNVFDQLLAHIADAPPLPVSQHRKEFLEFVRKNDLTAISPFYRGYPDLKVLDILTLQKRSREKN
jgi:hypothetical protein